MDKNYENDYTGDIKISDEVIATLAAKAAKEIEGIAGMTGGIVGNITAAVLGKRDSSKGIDVEMKDGLATVTLHVKVKYGVKIPEVAWRVQENVKLIIESVAGLTVEKVNVSVEGIDFTEDTQSVAVAQETPAEIIDIDVTEEK
ncbi:MAG: Asp23/Gls24 family envelope stress response protein [Clostridia bacterium]|nr:Asp23/Gls24 family envelope stress response protein [Clostridia bacterium]